jgi:hypothetical protein
MAKITEVSIPEYDLKKKVDYDAVGRKIDDHLKKHFRGKKAVIRAISSSERNEDLDETVKTILKHGTDRTCPDVKGRGYDKNPDIDIFGAQYDIDSAEAIGRDFVQHFYEDPQKHGADPLKIDLLVVYDAQQLERVPHSVRDKPRHDGYRFKHPEKKHEAVHGVVKIK